jgi:hypothetical protein
MSILQGINPTFEHLAGYERRDLADEYRAHLRITGEKIQYLYDCRRKQPEGDQNDPSMLLKNGPSLPLAYAQ